MISALRAPFNGVEEVPQYPINDLMFTIVAVGGILIILSLIKHWRDW